MDYKRYKYLKRRSLAFESFFNKTNESTYIAEAKAVAETGTPKKQKGNPLKAHRQKSNQNHKKDGTNILLALVIIMSVVLISTLFLSRVHIGAMISSSGKNDILQGGSTSTSASAGIVLMLNSKPSHGSSAELSTEEVANKILPCVVGIVQYQQGSLTETGEGSGIIMSADGRIITNNHVIEGASSLEVVTHDGTTYLASIVGSDSRTDLAVLKISASNLKYAQFGNSDQCKVGEQVVAVGNPSGLQLAGSVTQGIISALNRNVDVGNGPMNLIQTDAAINPGNSGGALVNMYGQVVGINSAKIAQSGYEGIGFSIPINTVKPVVDSIIENGYVKGRVKLGLDCRGIDSVTAQLNNIPVGIYISYVEPGSSAQLNGLLADDIITAIDGVTVKNTDTLIIERDKHKPGDELTLTIYRRSEKKQYDIKVTLIEDKGAAGISENGDW